MRSDAGMPGAIQQNIHIQLQKPNSTVSFLQKKQYIQKQTLHLATVTNRAIQSLQNYVH